MNRRGTATWLPLMLLAVMLAIFFIPLILGTRSLFWGLPALQFYPWRKFAFDELQAGRIPFLNPYNGAGAPLLANYQSAILYPPNWLHLILPDSHAMSLIAVLHIFWAGYGMWKFTGQLGISVFGRGTSLLAYAFAGYSIARMGSFPTADAVAWIPWLFWALTGVAEKRTFGYIGLLGLISAMLLLSGHAQTAFYAFLAAGLYSLWQAVYVNLPRPLRLKALAMIGGGVALGIGIAATQLLFTLELLSESQRSGGVDYKELTNLSFSPLRLLVLLMPNFFGSPVDGSYLTPDSGVYFEDMIYIGIVPLIAAIAAIFGWIQRRTLLEHWKSYRSVPFWILLSVVGFILAMGKYGPVYRTLYDYVPTFDAFREPVRWMIWPVFALCVLAGIGVQNWGRSPRVFFWTRLSAAGGIGFVVMAVAVRQTSPSIDETASVLLDALTAFGCWFAGSAILTLAQPDETWNIPFMRWETAVLIFVAADLAWAAQGLNPTVPEQFFRGASITPPQARLYWYKDYEEKIKFEQTFDLADYRTATLNWPYVRRSLLPNLNILDKMSLYNNFDPLLPRYQTRYIELIEGLGRRSEALLRAAGIGQVYGNTRPVGWKKIQGDDPTFQAPQEPPFVWIVPRAIWASDDQAVEAALLQETWNPEQEVILSAEEPGDTLVLEASPPLKGISFFEVVEDTPTQKKYRVVTDGSGYLVLATSWYPGWSVSIDGSDQTLYRANLAFMAVEIPEGGGEVTFRYLPTIGVPGVLITLISLFTSIGFMAFDLFRQEAQ